MADPLSSDMLRRMHAYWRAANYLSVGQIYLQDNPLLETPLKLEHIKPRLLGHWGTTTGLNFLYVHLNRLIKTYRRHNHDNIHVRGFRDEGTTTTPFDMVVLNNLDRYQLALDAFQDMVTKWRRRRNVTGRPWSVTSSTSASMATTCRKFETGVGRSDRFRRR